MCKVSLSMMWLISFRKGVRKQFLLTNGKTIYGFATKGEKFASCTNLADVTDSVACKVDIFCVG